MYALEGTFSVRLSWNLVRMFLLMKSQTSVKMSHVQSKTSSLGQILEKHCVRCRGHIFSAVIIKQCQNVCLDEIWMISKMGHVRSKTRSLLKLSEISSKQTFWPSFMIIGQKMWPLELTQGFSMIWLSHLVFDRTWLIFKLVWDFIKTNNLTKFHNKF